MTLLVTVTLVVIAVPLQRLVALATRFYFPLCSSPKTVIHGVRSVHRVTLPARLRAPLGSSLIAPPGPISGDAGQGLACVTVPRSSLSAVLWGRLWWGHHTIPDLLVT